MDAYNYRQSRDRVLGRCVREKGVVKGREEGVFEEGLEGREGRMCLRGCG